MKFRDSRQNSLADKNTSHSKSWNEFKVSNFHISPYSNVYLQTKGEKHNFICTGDENPSLLVVSPVAKTAEVRLVAHPPGHKEKANIIMHKCTKAKIFVAGIS